MLEKLAKYQGFRAGSFKDFLLDEDNRPGWVFVSEIITVFPAMCLAFVSAWYFIKWACPGLACVDFQQLEGLGVFAMFAGPLILIIAPIVFIKPISILVAALMISLFVGYAIVGMTRLVAFAICVIADALL